MRKAILFIIGILLLISWLIGSLKSLIAMAIAIGIIYLIIWLVKKYIFRNGSPV